MMDRNQSFLRIASALARSEEDARKYAEHLGELFDCILPERIGEEFASALAREDYDGAVKACAAYFRGRGDFSAAELLSEGEYDLVDSCL